MYALRLIVPQALAMVTPDKIQQYFNTCFRICALYDGGMSLTEWLIHDKNRKNLNKRIVRYSNLVQKSKNCKQKLESVLTELKKFNSTVKSSHRDFSVKVEKLVQLCDY